MAKWLAKEFDWDTGRYTGKYYDIAEAGIVAVFVDSKYGDDTAAGTAAAPFKTLTKAITTLNSTGADGSRIFMNGVFSENLPAQTYWYEFIGCGGGWNGMTIFARNENTGARPVFTQMSRYYNIRTVGYVNSEGTIASGLSSYFVNCFLVRLRTTPNLVGITSYFTVFFDCVAAHSAAHSHRQYGANNTNWDWTNVSGVNFWNYSINSHFNNSVVTHNNDTSLSTQYNTNGQYINPLELNFAYQITSPLLFAGTLDELTGVRRHVGAGYFGLDYSGLQSEFTEAGGAVVTDLTLDAQGRYTLTPPATTGSLVTAVMDLGNYYPITKIDVNNMFDFLAGEITEGIHEAFSSPRMTLTLLLKYGLTTTELTACPWLLMEYGKRPTFSGSGASRVGNAADTFDPTQGNYFDITARYLQLTLTLNGQ